MKTRLLILMFVFTYIIVQNLIFVYVLNILFEFKLSKWTLKHYRQEKKDFHIKFIQIPGKNGEVSPSFNSSFRNHISTMVHVKAEPKRTTLKSRVLAPNKIVNKSKLLQPPVAGKRKNYHYQNMKSFARMIGLHDKVKERYSRNQNISFPFDYIIKNEALCRLPLFLINFLLSSPEDFKLRSSIRTMWGSPRWRKVARFQLVHLLGKSEDAKINAQILNESKHYGDIVQVNFTDSYRNLTLKVLSALHWTTNFCPYVEWFLKSDIDVFINLFILIGFLKSHSKKEKSSHTQILCKPKPVDELHPLRNSTRHKKWNVDTKEYPFDNYPPSCYGPGYIIPGRLIPKFYATSDKLTPFRMEDVYYTGIIPQILDENLNIFDIGTWFPWRPKSLAKDFSKILMILEIHKYHPRVSMADLWERTISNLKFKSIKKRTLKQIVNDGN